MPQSSDNPNTRSLTLERVRRAGVVVLGIAVVIVADGAWVRLQAHNEQTSWSLGQAVPNVRVVGDSTLTLLGNRQTYYSAQICAGVSGYVRQCYEDVGAVVHQGDVLAEIDTPELDQQIEQRRADLANAEAAQMLSKTTAARWSNLLAVDAVSKQEADEKAGDLATKNAQVNAAKANDVRLQSMKVFARITAPFDGVVTERRTDIGALVNVGVGSAAPSLFTVSDTRKIRLYVRVPQNYSTQIHDHMAAKVSLPEYPGETFMAKLVSTLNAISDQSNTLLVQLEAANANGKLKPRDYGDVSFGLVADDNRLAVPVSALMLRGDGLQVAVVDNRVIMKSIQIAEDLRSRVEVSSGLDASHNVIDNPPDSLGTGDARRVVASSAQQHAESE
jgi:RND family efflux transporter MFP subunit